MHEKGQKYLIIIVGELLGNRLFGRHRRIWQGSINTDATEMC